VHSGVRLATWDKAVEAPAISSKEFVEKAPERKKDWKQFIRSRCWRKASKGEAQERWELKEASKVCKELKTVERVAKP
jgi:hypothetical protein